VIRNPPKKKTEVLDSLAVCRRVVIKAMCSRILKLSLAVAIFLLFGQASASMPVVPNESLIEGVVSEYAIVSSGLVGIVPEQVLYRLTVSVESSGPVGEMPDLIKDKVGQYIQFYSKEELFPDLFGKRIRAKASYRGARGLGKYWIYAVEVIR
jgi:hypothetical protein